MALDHLLQEVSDDLLLEDGGWILLESASNPSFRARVEDFSGSYVECLERSELSVRFIESSGSSVTFVDMSEGVS